MRSARALAVAAGLIAACNGTGPNAPLPTKGEGEGCAVTAECIGALRCLDGVCTAGTCADVRECSGDPGGGCALWACVASRCVPGCFEGADAGPRADAGAVPPDAGTPADAGAVVDAGTPADAGAVPDAGTPADTGVVADAGELADSGVVADSGASSDSGVVPDAGAPADSGVVADSGVAADAGVVADSGVPPDAGTGCDPTPRAPLSGELVINEFLADPGSTVATGDANADGVRSGTDDEFVEIVNVSAHAVAMAGVVLSDSTNTRHTFAALSLGCGQGIVVFGGGPGSGPSWRSNWVVASTGGLSLNNGTETIRLGTSAAAPADLRSLSYGAEAASGQSRVLSPELVGTAYVNHSAATGAAGRLFSPGVRVDGAAF